MGESLSAWLALRQEADTAARSRALTDLIVEQVRGPRPLRVLDLGTGTGSNIGGGSSSGGSSSGGSASGANGKGQGLAVTGASLLVPMLLASTLIGAGLLLTLAGRRPDENEDSFMARWWLTN